MEYLRKPRFINRCDSTINHHAFVSLQYIHAKNVLLTIQSRHLLGKKSWNVYNTENIAKVKRDEAAAAAREANEEQRMQEVDAERRIQILRGLQVDAAPPPLPPPTDEKSDIGLGARDGSGRERKRRRIAGEDDTDRDIRLAQERNVPTPARPETQIHRKKEIDTPLTDSKGHINLFPAETSRAARAPKNPEAESEAATAKQEFEDQYTMRFSNAAGFKQAVGQTPWYQSTPRAESPKSKSKSKEEETAPIPTKDIWGNADPRRKERQKQRTAAGDPLALIQKGVSSLRKVERERKIWAQEQLIDAERNRRQKRRRKDDLEEEDGFRLDHSSSEKYKDSHHHRSHHHHHHHHRSHHHHNQPQPQPQPQNSNSKSTPKSKRPSEPTKTGWQAGRGGRYSNQFAASLDIG